MLTQSVYTLLLPSLGTIKLCTSELWHLLAGLLRLAHVSVVPRVPAVELEGFLRSLDPGVQRGCDFAMPTTNCGALPAAGNTREHSSMLRLSDHLARHCMSVRDLESIARPCTMHTHHHRSPTPQSSIDCVAVVSVA